MNTENNPFSQYPNLADVRLGSQVISATDEWFADKSRLLKSEAAVFIDDKYDDHGKWMDGWETRRKRDTGHDHCIIKLGLVGKIKGVDIDTSHFTDNYPPAASLDACYSPNAEPDANTGWFELLESVSLEGDNHHWHTVNSDQAVSHIRLNIYPDGGVARLRLYGEPICDWQNHSNDALIDLLAIENGGRAITCNDQHYGSILNVNMPGRGVNMGDGWETRRRREPGNDWAIFALGHAGHIKAVEIDTAHFKGNYPDKCSIQAGFMQGGTTESLITQSMFWEELLPPQKMQMDAIHRFEGEVQNIGKITHVRLNIIPDGGISRLRLFGTID